MNNQKQKKLIWKYFWQQKKEEVFEMLEEYWLSICIFMVVSGIFFQIGWLAIPPKKGLIIVGLCMIGFWVLIGFIVLISGIVNWIQNNWKDASARAKEELNKTHKNERS